MENAPKLEKETLLHVASINEELISGAPKIGEEKRETPSVEAIPKLSEIKKISDLKEEIKKLEQKINWTKVYREHEKHLYDPGQPYIPLMTQLRMRQQELAARKKEVVERVVIKNASAEAFLITEQNRLLEFHE